MHSHKLLYLYGIVNKPRLWLRVLPILWAREIDEKPFIHFLHINKTGGTAVWHALNSGEDASSPYGTIVYHPHCVVLRDIPRDDKVVFFLRDPLSRFVSGFNDRRRKGRPRFFRQWNLGEWIAFKRFSTPNQLALALSSKKAEEKDAAQKAMKSIYHVRASYWEWFESADYLRSRLPDILFIGFQERLADDFEILKSKLGLSESVMLPRDDFRANRRPTDLDRALESEAIANLRDWYRRDFQFIQLCEKLGLVVSPVPAAFSRGPLEPRV